jgi:hypothetical protein
MDKIFIKENKTAFPARWQKTGFLCFQNVHTHSNGSLCSKGMSLKEMLFLKSRQLLSFS